MFGQGLAYTVNRETSGKKRLCTYQWIPYSCLFDFKAGSGNIRCNNMAFLAFTPTRIRKKKQLYVSILPINL